MHSGRCDKDHAYAGFLAADPEVAITRRVPETGAERFKIKQLTSPPRVLFVVGSSISDPVIRPGAEYMGLVQNLEANGRSIHMQVLLNATTATLAEAVKAFMPSVVHIICHGQLSDLGNGRETPTLEFRAKQGSTAPDYVHAERLYANLTSEPGVPSPQVVVLNACSTATSDQLKVGRPFAAELVQLGVPIVVGMSGRVSDQACRLFARKFYAALLEGGDLAYAAAGGRRAALAHGSIDPRGQVDWALPTLFLAEGVPADVRVEINVDDVALQWLNAAREFNKRPDYPVFPGRWDFFKLYRELVSTNRHQFLAVAAPRADNTDPTQVSQPQLGTSRLLKELAAEAVRDGHVPVLVSKDWLEQKNSPATAKDFLDAIARSTAKTLGILARVNGLADLSQRWNWMYLRRCIDAYPNAPDMTGLPLSGDFDLYGLELADKIARAFTLDVMALHAAIGRKDTTIIFFLDDAHQLVYGDVALGLLGVHGLRDSRVATATRAVIAYNDKAVDGQHTTIKQIQDWANSHDVLPVALGGLHEPIDLENPLKSPEHFHKAALIYKHFLSHWRDDGRPHPLSFTLSEEAPAVRKFIAYMAECTQGGVPARLSMGDLPGIIRYEVRVNSQGGLFRKLDDDDALQDLAALSTARMA